MIIDPQVIESEGAFYRVSAKAFIVADNKILLVRDWDDEWWGFPGGGIDHGETPIAALGREIIEELGVTANDFTLDQDYVYVGVGAIVKNIPRVNIFCRASIDLSKIQPTQEIVEARWFTYEEFTALQILPMTADVDIAQLDRAVRKLMGM